VVLNFFKLVSKRYW